MMKLDSYQTRQAYLTRYWTPRMLRYAEIEFDETVSVYECLSQRMNTERDLLTELEHTHLKDEYRLRLLSEKQLSRKYFLPVSFMRQHCYLLNKDEYQKCSRSHLARKGEEKKLSHETLIKLFSNALFYQLPLNEVATAVNIKPSSLQEQFEHTQYDENAVTKLFAEGSPQELCLPRTFLNEKRYGHLSKEERRVRGLKAYAERRKQRNLAHYEKVKQESEFLQDIERVKELQMTHDDVVKKWGLTTSEVRLMKSDFRAGKIASGRRRALIQQDARSHRLLTGSSCEWILDEYSERLHQVRNLSLHREFAYEFFNRYVQKMGVEDYSSLSFERILNRKIITFDLACQLKEKGLLSIDESAIRESHYERDFREFLCAHQIEFECGNRSILEGQEIDFYLPEYHLGIELNPIESHHSNEYAEMYFSPKKRGFHFMKMKKASQKGVELLQFHSTELARECLKDWLLTKLQIGNERLYARQTTWSTATSAEARAFCERYHLGGFSPATFHLKCIDQEGRLVGVASLSKRGSSYELKRLCWKPHFIIIGGLSKMCKHIFKAHYDCKEIISFSDNSLGSGRGYAAAGFTFVCETGPRMRYISNTDPLDTYSWQIATPWSLKQGLLKDADLSSPDEIEEYIEYSLPHQTDEAQGYHREFTAGSKKWKLERKEESYGIN